MTDVMLIIPAFARLLLGFHRMIADSAGGVVELAVLTFSIGIGNAITMPKI